MSPVDAWQVVAPLLVVFGHQSVGDNILSGVTREAQARGVALNIVDFKVGENEKPATKLAAFEERLAKGDGARAQVALLKFCYVDFRGDTDVDALFGDYVAMVERLSKSHPSLRFVHATAPLSTVQTGLKAFLKHLVGRPAQGEAENQARHRYNELVRARFASTKAVFDIARVESEGPHTCSFERDGKRWPCLAPALTDDGGHLNEKGQAAAAHAFVEAIAAAVR